MHRHDDDDEQLLLEFAELAYDQRELRVQVAILRTLRRIEHCLCPHLTSIQIAFKEPSMPIPVPGPVTLTAVGESTVASVLGFDQFGNPFTGTMPPVTLSSSDSASAIVTFDPATGLCTAVANGVANITGVVTSAEGLALTDTETCTVAIPVVVPVLSSIKVAFAPTA